MPVETGKQGHESLMQHSHMGLWGLLTGSHRGREAGAAAAVGIVGGSGKDGGGACAEVAGVGVAGGEGGDTGSNKGTRREGLQLMEHRERSSAPTTPCCADYNGLVVLIKTYCWR
eukprot:1143089-Pelagomonas_calceolata.AAC.17